MPAGVTKGLDTPELKKKKHSQFTVMKKPGNKHNLSGAKWAAVVKTESVDAPNVVT
jgi:hypothetical protein